MTQRKQRQTNRKTRVAREGTVHAQLATLIVASSSSIQPWPHPTCITSNMPRHTKHEHAPGVHPHAATSEFLEKRHENRAYHHGRTLRELPAHSQAPPCLSLCRLMVRLLIVLSFLQVACTHGEVVGVAVRAPSDLVSPRSWLLSVRVRGAVLAACLLRLVAHVGAQAVRTGLLRHRQAPLVLCCLPIPLLGVLASSPSVRRPSLRPPTVATQPVTITMLKMPPTRAAVALARTTPRRGPRPLSRLVSSLQSSAQAGVFSGSPSLHAFCYLGFTSVF
jgi:hypothetical protein